MEMFNYDIDTLTEIVRRQLIRYNTLMIIGESFGESTETLIRRERKSAEELLKEVLSFLEKNHYINTWEKEGDSK